MIVKLLKKIFRYKIIRYTLWWGLAALLDLFLLRFFTDIVGLYYLISACVAFVFSLGFGYFFQKYITFQNRSNKHFQHWWLFLLFQWAWQGWYILLLWLLTSPFHLYYLYAAIIAKGIVFVRNYVMNHFFNFK